MSRASRLAALLVATLAGAAAPARAATALPPATLDAWSEVKTGRFEISTQGSDLEARQMARHLERLAETLERTMQGFVVDGARPVRILVFRDRAAFLPYCPFRDDAFGSTVGFQVSGVDAEYLAVYGTESEQLLSFVSHEYLHAVVARSFGSVPLWMNEGLAELYSSFRPRRRMVEVGRPIAAHVEWLRHHPAPVAQILRIAGNSPDYQGGPRRQTVYAESWALVHALRFDPAGPDRFGRLLTELARGRTSELALGDVYGPRAIDSLEADLRVRMSRMTLPYVEHEWETSVDDLPLASRALDRPALLLRLGELLAHSRDSMHAKARAHFEACWSADSSQAEAAAWLATLAGRAGEDAAAARWRTRVALAPRASPRALGIVGHALARRRLDEKKGFTHPAPGASPAALEARDLLDRASRALPEAAEWLVPYGLTFLDETGDVSPGIGALLEARGRMPRRSDVVGALAMLTVRSGNPGAALRLYAEIPYDDERPYWRGSVANLVLQDAWRRAEAKARGGAFAEAESILTRTREGLEEPWTRTESDRLIAWIRGHAKSGSPETAKSAAGDSGAKDGRSADRPRGAGTRTAALAPGYRKAMTAGAWADAEAKAQSMVRAAGNGRERAHAESLLAEARCRSQLESAEAVLRLGNPGRACEILAELLGGRPTAATRREAERLRQRHCR